MKEQFIRFGVYDRGSKRAATWKCWSYIGNGKSDVYLCNRSMGGALKASFHQSGKWHISYSENFFEEQVKPENDSVNDRFIHKWGRPKELAPGVTLAFRIITPWSSVTSQLSEKDRKSIVCIPTAPEGKAIEVDLLITTSNVQVDGWPGQRSMGTKLVGSMLLSNGERLWIVYWETDMPDLGKLTGKPNFFKGRSMEDIVGKMLRMQIYSNENDGSRVIYDCILDATKKVEDKNI